jgi:serine/threonine-protein kinase HipA
MQKSALNVFANTERSGRLDRSAREEDTILFTYREDCSRDLAVSLTMPVRPDQYDAMAGLLPIFEMNLPEGGLKDRLRNQFAKAIPEFDDLDLLSIVGSSQIGRLRYSQQQQLREDVPAQNLDEILQYRGTADLFSHLLDRFAMYSGISGFQPKVLIRDEKAPPKLSHRGATHIVKAFDSSEYPELAANEFICTCGATAAGIVTPRVQLSENRKLLVAERFDLRPDGSYLGIEDFCVLDARRAHGRYDGSYENIARRILDFVSVNALAEAREQYALMVAFACAIENGDAHLKNFAVTYETPEREVRLAPAYDIVSTTPYIPQDTLALTLDNSKSFPERDQLIKFIRFVTSRSQRSALELLDRVTHGVSVSIARAAEYGKRYEGARSFADRLIATLTRGLSRLGLKPSSAHASRVIHAP